MFKNFRDKSGQSLLEVLVALSVAGVLIVGTVLAVSVSLRSSTEGKFIQTGSLLVAELLDNASVATQASWQKIDSLLTPPENYYVSTTGPSFIFVSGTDAVTIDGALYTRYFTAEPVSRDPQEHIEDVYNPLRNDPSTKKIVGFVILPNGGQISIQKYITRNKSSVWVQTDWSGGASADQFFASDQSKFSSQSPVGSIDFKSKPGSAKLQGVP